MNYSIPVTPSTQSVGTATFTLACPPPSRCSSHKSDIRSVARRSNQQEHRGFSGGGRGSMPDCASCTCSGEAGSMPQLNPRAPPAPRVCNRSVSFADASSIGAAGSLAKKHQQRDRSLSSAQEPPSQRTRRVAGWRESHSRADAPHTSAESCNPAPSAARQSRSAAQEMS